MARFGIVTALLLVLAASCGSDVVAEEPSAVAAMMQAARATGVPAGIVLRDGNDLCRKPGAPVEKQSDDPMQRLRGLTDAYGYRVDTSGPVVLVTPNEGGPDVLKETLHHLWATFSAQESVMHTMGMILNGWMKTAAGAKSWAIDSGSSPEEPILHLPAGDNETSQEIANRIVSLGSRGVWVAWQSRATRMEHPAGCGW